MTTSITIASGRAAAIRSCASSGARGLVDIYVDSLECRSEQSAKCVVVVDQQEAQVSTSSGVSGSTFRAVVYE